MPIKYAPEDLQTFLDLHNDGLMVWPSGLNPEAAEGLLQVAKADTLTDTVPSLIGSVRKALTCPLTKDILREPMLCVVDGRTYEHEAISHRISLGPNWKGEVTPLAPCKISKDDLVPNHAVMLVLELLRIVEEKFAAKPIGNSATLEEGHWALCPINHEIMQSPCMTPSGHSYEKTAIVQAIQRSGQSPQTRTSIKVSDLRANLALKESLKEFKKSAAQETMKVEGAQAASIVSSILAHLKSSAQSKKRVISPASFSSPPRRRLRVQASWPASPKSESAESNVQVSWLGNS